MGVVRHFPFPAAFGGSDPCRLQGGLLNSMKAFCFPRNVGLLAVLAQWPAPGAVRPDLRLPEVLATETSPSRQFLQMVESSSRKKPETKRGFAEVLRLPMLPMLMCRPVDSDCGQCLCSYQGLGEFSVPSTPGFFLPHEVAGGTRRAFCCLVPGTEV